jgi:hypothetical protein
MFGRRFENHYRFFCVKALRRLCLCFSNVSALSEDSFLGFQATGALHNDVNGAVVLILKLV